MIYRYFVAVYRDPSGCVRAWGAAGSEAAAKRKASSDLRVFRVRRLNAGDSLDVSDFTLETTSLVCRPEEGCP
jgi:hypothetical protein